MPVLAGNPEDHFTNDAAQINLILPVTGPLI